MAHPAYRSSEYQRNRRLLLASKPLCYTGCGQRATTADHIVPKSLGGGPQLSNLRPACLRCNSSRGNKMLRREVNAW